MVDWLTVLQPRTSETESCWSDVPPEVWSLILSRLFFNDHHNFRLVCKSWNLICPVKPPLPPPVNLPDFNSPCLMYSLTGTMSWKFYHSLYDDFYSLDFPELVDAEIYFSKYGWLLMGHKLTLFFFNPFTKVKIELPPATDSFMWASFTSSPTYSDCYVFGLYSVSGFCNMDFGLIKVGDEDWKSEHFHDDEQTFWVSNCAPVFHGGIYYLLDYEAGEIGIFDSRKDENRWTQFGNSAEIVDEEEEEEGEEAHPHESYIVEVEGEIWGVFVTKDDGRVSVKKLDLTKMCWRKLDSLGNKCLYVSRYGSFAETCAISGMANKIYFNKFHGNSGVMYSLSTKMYHSVAGDFASKEGYGLKQVDYGVWIKPSIEP